MLVSPYFPEPFGRPIGFIVATTFCFVFYTSPFLFQSHRIPVCISILNYRITKSQYLLQMSANIFPPTLTISYSREKTCIALITDSR